MGVSEGIFRSECHEHADNITIDHLLLVGRPLEPFRRIRDGVFHKNMERHDAFVLEPLGAIEGGLAIGLALLLGVVNELRF